MGHTPAGAPQYPAASSTSPSGLPPPKWPISILWLFCSSWLSAAPHQLMPPLCPPLPLCLFFSTSYSPVPWHVPGLTTAVLRASQVAPGAVLVVLSSTLIPSPTPVVLPSQLDPSASEKSTDWDYDDPSL